MRMFSIDYEACPNSNETVDATCNIFEIYSWFLHYCEALSFTHKLSNAFGILKSIYEVISICLRLPRVRRGKCKWRYLRAWRFDVKLIEYNVSKGLTHFLVSLTALLCMVEFGNNILKILTKVMYTLWTVPLL